MVKAADCVARLAGLKSQLVHLKLCDLGKLLLCASVLPGDNTNSFFRGMLRGLS